MGKTMREFRDEVRKGTLLSSAGGILPPGAFREFMQEVETAQPFLQNITIDTITRPTQEIHHLSAASRQMRAVSPGTAATSGTVTPVERTYTPTRAVLALDVSYDWIDDNADERNADEVIRAYLADLVAADLVDLGANGDGATASFLNINKGWIQIATDDSDSDVNTYTGANGTMLGGSGVFANLRDKLPTQYRRDAMIYCSTSEFDDFLDELGTRATGLGDEVLRNGGPVPWQGYGVMGVPNWPDDSPIMTPKWNLRLGMWKDIIVVAENVPRKSIVEYTVEMRVDYQYANGSALVLGATAAT